MTKELNEIVEVVIDQQTAALTEPAFNTPAIVALFDEAGISGWSADQRAKFYGSDSEMELDGFPADHVLRVALNSFLRQSPRTVDRVLIGREDSGDANMAAALNAIADEQPDFYDLHYTFDRSGVLTMDKDFVSDNSIAITITTSGATVEVPAVDFDTDNATTYAAIKAAIEAALTGYTVTVDAGAKTISIAATGKAIKNVTVAVTGGAVNQAEFDADFVASNSIAINLRYGSGSSSDTVVPEITVPFDTDNATTYANIETAIEAAIAGSVVVVDAVARTVTIAIPTADRITSVYTVTGGASQAVATYSELSPAAGSYAIDALTTPQETKLKECGAWVQSNERIFGVVSNDTDASGSAYDAGASPQPDIGAYFKSLSYDRCYGHFDKNEPISELNNAVAGENLPYGPPVTGEANTWSFKTPKGVSAKVYTSSERANLSSKNYNVYTIKAGQNVTLFNRTFQGEPIEAIINIDWVTFLLQRNIFTQLLNKRAVPLNDNGMLTVVGKVIEAAEEAESKGALVPGSSQVTYPKFSELPEVDRNAGVFSGIVLSAQIQRAIQKVNVTFKITA
jgi:hypothetical protein